MVLIGILMLTTIINLTSSAPLPPYKEELDNFVYYITSKDLGIPVRDWRTEILNRETDQKDVNRVKRIGSLSIVNNLDVLRQKVLLELARRKALQDQRQIDENRRVLDRIGKRSVPAFYDETEAGNFVVKPGTRNQWSNRFEWLEKVAGSQDDRMAKVQANELHL